MAAVVGVQHDEPGPRQRVLLAGQPLAGHVDRRLDVAVVEHDARERPGALRPDQHAGDGELVAAVGDVVAGVGVGLVLGAQDPRLARRSAPRASAPAARAGWCTSGSGASVGVRGAVVGSGGRCRAAAGRACRDLRRAGARAGDRSGSSGSTVQPAASTRTTRSGGGTAHTWCTDDQPNGFVSPWIRPSVMPSRCPRPPQRPAMISAAMLIAVSSGVRAPRSRPIGLDSRSSSSSVEPGLAEPGQPVVVGTPRAHRADVGHLGQPQRDLEQGYVELRVVGQHGDHGARVDPAGLVLGRQVAVRPVDDHVVGLREPAVGREHRPGVADRDVVAEEGADPGHRGREVDGAEDQQPRLGRERPHEDPHPLAAALAVGTVGERGVVPGRQQPHRVVAHRVVRARGRVRVETAARSSDSAPGRTTSRRPSQAGSGCSMTVASATGRPASMSAAISPSSGKVSCETFST